MRRTRWMGALLGVWLAGCDGQGEIGAPEVDAAPLQLRSIRDRGEVVEIEVSAPALDVRLRGATPTLFVGDAVVRAHRLVPAASGARLRFFVAPEVFEAAPPDAQLALRTQAGQVARAGFSSGAPRLSDVTVQRAGGV